MIRNEDPIIQKEILLEKFPGKGGWTFARLPEIPNQKNPFGWKKVRGRIDDYEFSQYHLMPMGNGHLFLPVKAAIRKKIKKKVGDMVKVILYSDDESIKIPDDFMICLKDEPQALRNFLNFPEKDQSTYIKWIYRAKTINLQIERMAEAINSILKDGRK